MRWVVKHRDFRVNFSGYPPHRHLFFHSTSAMYKGVFVSSEFFQDCSTHLSGNDNKTQLKSEATNSKSPFSTFGYTP